MVSHLGTCGEWVARTRTPAAYFSLQPFVGLPLFTREDDSKNFLDLLALGLKLFCPVLRVLRLGTVGLSFGRNPILSIQTFSRSNQSLDEPALLFRASHASGYRFACSPLHHAVFASS